MKLRYEYSAALDFDRPVERHVFRLRAVPCTLPGQRVVESRLVTDPGMSVAGLIEPPFGNVVTTGRIDGPHRHFGFVSSGVVETCPDAPDTTPPPAYASFFTPLTAPCGKARAMLDEAGDMGDGLEEAARLCNFVHKELRYRQGVTSTLTTAADALALGCGVCQDFSHVLLSLLRLRGMSALYVSGLVVGTGETHAWVSVFADGVWKSFDPTNGRECDGSYIVLARGMDFTDASVDQGIFRGAARQTLKARVSVALVD